MAVTANSIVTPQTPRSCAVGVTTANATFTTSPTNVSTLISAGLNGSRVTRVQAIPLETVTGNSLQLYRDKDGSGANKYLFNAQTSGADTVTATDAPTVVDFGYSDDNPLLLAAGEKVYCATGITKLYNFVAEWADY